MTRDTPIPGLRLVILLVAVGLGVVLWRLAFRPVFLPVGTKADISERDWPDMRLDLNRAMAAELALLPGIGADMATSMVEDRERNGPFTTVDDLARVHGIGPKTIEKLRPFVVVSDPSVVIPDPSVVLPDPSAIIADPSAVIADPAATITDPSAMIADPSAIIPDPSAVVTDPAATIADPD